MSRNNSRGLYSMRSSSGRERVHCQQSGRGVRGGGGGGLLSFGPEPELVSHTSVDAVVCAGHRGDLFVPSRENLEMSLKD